MKYIDKKDILVMFIIVIFAVIIALFYNYIRVDKIPYFKTDIKELIVDDSELFGAIVSDKNEIQNDNLATDTTGFIVDTIRPDTTEVLDTITHKLETLDYETLSKEAKKAETGDFGVITLSQMKKIATDTSEKFIIIDARKPDDYEQAHIGNAINIYPADNEDIVIEKIFTLTKSKIYIIYCDGGNCDLSHHLGGLLKIFDYKFFIFEGGWEEWSK